ncbi:MAG TPA: hypothetical protein VFH33_03310 [Candidatus Krumholzibacteria bacterium]|nr:hypothetical protein [Candidatus Krumholzibacteria bacterium]
MATHPGAGRELIDELIATRRHAQRLFVSLRFQGRDKEADEVETRVREITERLDTLLAGALKSWEGQATAMVARLRKLNHNLARDVAHVRQRAARTEDIAAALGSLGEALELLTTWGLWGK